MADKILHAYTDRIALPHAAWTALLPDLPDVSDQEEFLHSLAVSCHYMFRKATGSKTLALSSGHVARVNGRLVSKGDVVCVLFGCWKQQYYDPVATPTI